MVDLRKDLQYQTYLRKLERKNLLKPGILSNLMAAESSGRPDAVSHAGAVGAFQFMPATAERFGIDPKDPYQAADGAARYLRKLLGEFKSYPLAIAAYNSGEGTVRRYGGIPPFKETQNHVVKVLGDGKSGNVSPWGGIQRPKSRALEVFNAIPGAGLGGYEQVVGGQMQAAGKLPELIMETSRGLSAAPGDVQDALFPGPPKTALDAFNELVRTGKAYSDQGKERVRRNTPPDMNRTQRAFHTGLSSALTQSPALALGIGGGPAIAASAAGMFEGGRAFGNAEELTDVADRFKFAARNAVLEALPEKLSFNALLKPGDVLGKLRDFLVREIPGENFSEITQRINETVSGLAPTMTVGEVVDTVIDTTLATAVGGTAQSLAVSGVQKAQEALNKRPEMEFAPANEVFGKEPPKPEKVIRAGEVHMFGPLGPATKAAKDAVTAFVTKHANKAAPATETRPEEAQAVEPDMLQPKDRKGRVVTAPRRSREQVQKVIEGTTKMLESMKLNLEEIKNEPGAAAYSARGRLKDNIKKYTERVNALQLELISAPREADMQAPEGASISAPREADMQAPEGASIQVARYPKPSIPEILNATLPSTVTTPQAPPEGGPVQPPQVMTKAGKRFVTVQADPDMLAIMQRNDYAIDEADSVFGVNITKMNTQDDVKSVLAEVAAEYQGRFDERRRGVVAQDDTAALARLYATKPEKIRGLTEAAKGTAYNAEELRSIKVATLAAATDAWKAAKKADETKASVDLVMAAQAQGRLVLLQETLAGARAEAGRALGILRKPVSAEDIADPDMRQDIENMIEDSGGRPVLEALAKITKDARTPEEVRLAADLTWRQKTALEIYSIWINGLLSGTFTHARNVGSNTLLSLWHIPEHMGAYAIGGAKRIAQAPFDFLTGKQRDKTDRVYAAEIPAAILGTIDGVRGGLWMATRTALTGDSYFETSKVDPGTDAERNVGGVLAFTRIPTRLLASEDEFFKAIAFRQKIFELGAQDGKKQGKSGMALARHAKEFSEVPTKAALREAMDFAHEQTFTNRLGAIGQAWMNARNTTPGMRVVAPFMRTPTNIVKRAMNMTPFGVLTFDQKTPGSKVGSLAIKKALKDGGRAADQVYARVAIGSFVMAAFFLLTAQGLVTGGGPSDPRRRKIWLQNHRPYSFLMPGGDRTNPDHWIEYKWIEPAGMVVGMAADIAELVHGMTNDEFDDIVAAAVFSVTQNITSKTMMQGLNSIMEAIHDAPRYASRWAQQLAGSMVPTIVANYAKSQDPVARDTDAGGVGDSPLMAFARGLVYKVMSRLPEHTSHFPPRLDVRGNPIIYMPGYAPEWTGKMGELFSPAWQYPAHTDPVSQRLFDAGYAPRGAPTKIGDVDLSAWEKSRYYEMGQRAGYEVLDRLWEHGGPARIGVPESAPTIHVDPGFGNLNDFQVKELAQAVFADSWNAARDELGVLYPRLGREMGMTKAGQHQLKLRRMGRDTEADALEGARLLELEALRKQRELKAGMQ